MIYIPNECWSEEEEEEEGEGEGDEHGQRTGGGPPVDKFFSGQPVESFFVYRFIALFIGEYYASSKWQLILMALAKFKNITLSAAYNILKQLVAELNLNSFFTLFLFSAIACHTTNGII